MEGRGDEPYWFSLNCEDDPSFVCTYEVIEIEPDGQEITAAAF